MRRILDVNEDQLIAAIIEEVYRCFEFTDAEIVARVEAPALAYAVLSRLIGQAPTRGSEIPRSPMRL